MNRPVPIIMRSGPDPREQEAIRVMVLDAKADVEALRAAFPDIEPGSLAAWHRSLQPKVVEPAPEPQPKRRKQP